MSDYENALECVRVIQSKTDYRPRIAIVLGSGLGDLADQLEDACSIPYGELPHFAVSTAPGHKGRLVLGKLCGRQVLCMQGRLHLYEGYPIQQVVFPIRVMKLLGIQTLILTNAAGGVDLSYTPGDLMLLSDHINFMGQNPLTGPNDERFGPRFHDMGSIYNPELRQLAHKAAGELGFSLHEGVYLGYMGPSYETPAEIRAFRLLGANAVGMSTVPEAIAANHCDMDILAISCITNMAAGILPEKLDENHVIEVANRVGARFQALVRRILELLPQA